MRTLAVGVVVPVHNEDELLPAALDALDTACRRLVERRIRCHTVIVLDACTDRSEPIARLWSEHLGPVAASVVTITARNVGRARQSGADTILAHFDDVAPERIWLATTDADSQVPPTWLTGQLRHHEAGAELWTGRVEIIEPSGRAPAALRRWRRAYAAEARPVHGASLGVAASAFLAVGGFAPLPTGEDRALHAAVVATGASDGHGGGAPVLTSARQHARAPLGFAYALSTYNTGHRIAGADDERASSDRYAENATTAVLEWDAVSPIVQ